MAHDPHHRPAGLRPPASPADPFSLALWLLWALSIAAMATWIAWPAIRGLAPLDMPRLVIMSALTGAVGLLLLAILEIRFAPWRFLD